MSARSLDPRFNLHDPRFEKERDEDPKIKKKTLENEDEFSALAEEADDAEVNEVEEENGDSNHEDDAQESNEAADAEDGAKDGVEAESADQSSSTAAANNSSSAGAQRRAMLAGSGSTSDKTGIVYLSRIPPGMKPAQLRHILSQYGEVGRLYLAPENDAKRKNRKKSGGTGRKCFTEGWVEFKRRKVAHAVALSLNNQIMGGDRRKYYYYDTWNVKYLPGFKWHHLTEKIAYEKQMREKRLRTEISQVKRENNLYLERVEKARVAQKIADRREKNKQGKNEGQAAEDPTPASAPTPTPAPATAPASAPSKAPAKSKREHGDAVPTQKSKKAKKLGS